MGPCQGELLSGLSYHITTSLKSYEATALLCWVILSPVPLSPTSGNRAEAVEREGEAPESSPESSGEEWMDPTVSPPLYGHDVLPSWSHPLKKRELLGSLISPLFCGD